MESLTATQLKLPSQALYQKIDSRFRLKENIMKKWVEKFFKLFTIFTKW